MSDFHQYIRDFARSAYSDIETVQVDDDALVVPIDDGDRYWVQAWVLVDLNEGINNGSEPNVE